MLSKNTKWKKGTLFRAGDFLNHKNDEEDPINNSILNGKLEWINKWPSQGKTGSFEILANRVIIARFPYLWKTKLH